MFSFCSASVSFPYSKGSDRGMHGVYVPPILRFQKDAGLKSLVKSVGPTRSGHQNKWSLRVERGVESWGLCLRELTWRKITQGDTWHRRDKEKRR